MGRKDFNTVGETVRRLILPTGAEAAALPGTGEPSQTGTKKKPLLPARKKRLNLVMPEELFGDIEKIAYMRKSCVTGIICRAVKEYRDKELRALEQYDAVFAGTVQNGTARDAGGIRAAGGPGRRGPPDVVFH